MIETKLASSRSRSKHLILHLDLKTVSRYYKFLKCLFMATKDSLEKVTIHIKCSFVEDYGQEMFDIDKCISKGQIKNLKSLALNLISEKRATKY